MSQLFKFYAPLKVRFNETDLQGHVNFGCYLTYFDVGATEYLDAIGYGYERLLADGVDLLYAEAHCNYHSPLKWPEAIRVYTRLAPPGRRSLRYEFALRAESDGREVATGHVVAITAERGTWAKREVPAGLRAAIAAYEGPADVSAA
ncbi:MAG: acyl-CoA thioesterase [Anaerolineales bacterium]|nr:acyl-CoA thioesterase [Anaerolineales bacterium]